jgi:K+-sensing histidine kinase KdpD
MSKEGIMGLASNWLSDEDTPMDYVPDKKEIIDMIKMLSHDIRSPLITIAAGLKQLKKGAYGLIDKGVTEELETLYEIATKASGNMEEFMGRAFLLDGDLESPREPLDIAGEIIEPILNELRKESGGRKISLENGISLKRAHITIGNRFLLKAVFRNLLRNAFKHGGTGCEVSIGMVICGSVYRINIFNTGIPVPEEKQEMLFKKYCQINKKDRNSDSMGLGLFFVREILEIHGGKIWYRAAEAGSNFIFTLPKYKKILEPKRVLTERYPGNADLYPSFP